MMFSSAEKSSDDSGLVMECALNFGSFINKIVEYDFPEFHKEWFDLLKYKRVLIEAPRGHGKTRFLVNYMAWKCFYNTHEEWLITSNSLGQAKEIMEVFTNLLLDNPILKSLVPDNRDLSWSQTKIVTSTKCKIQCRANNPNVRGCHPDYLIADEIGQYQDKDNFYGPLTNTTNAKKGSIFCIGTPETGIDLISDLKSPESVYVSKSYQAIKTDGTPLWPQMYTTKVPDDPKSMDIFEDGVWKRSLARIKQSLPIVNWEREYMCNPLGDESSAFPHALLVHSFDKESCFVFKGLPERRYYMGYDVAMSDSKSADYSVWTIVSVDHNNVKRIERIEFSQGESFEVQIARTKKLHENFHCNLIVIDRGNMGRIMYDRLVDDGFNVEGYDSQGKGKYDLLINLRYSFDNKKVIIPRDSYNRETLFTTDRLVNELMNMGFDITPKTKRLTFTSRGGHDDMVMSLALAVWGSRSSYVRPTIRFI